MALRDVLRVSRLGCLYTAQHDGGGAELRRELGPRSVHVHEWLSQRNRAGGMFTQQHYQEAWVPMRCERRRCCLRPGWRGRREAAALGREADGGSLLGVRRVPLVALRAAALLRRPLVLCGLHPAALRAGVPDAPRAAVLPRLPRGLPEPGRDEDHAGAEPPQDSGRGLPAAVLPDAAAGLRAGVPPRPAGDGHVLRVHHHSLRPRVHHGRHLPADLHGCRRPRVPGAPERHDRDGKQDKQHDQHRPHCRLAHQAGAACRRLLGAGGGAA
mmetsp:Transcript_50906/g.143294  ORF Transcript_50906/g.143294 Transcript_50906/m.143294 type:complete len:270 (+) Transcript_50906:748-1557(+)